MISIERQLRSLYFLLESKKEEYSFNYKDEVELGFYLVDGGKVRTNDEAEFIGGGHHLVYSWIPENEVWLESTFSKEERIFFTMHELFEYLLIKYDSDKYEEAHDIANYYEGFLRRKPKEAEKTIRDYVSEYHKERKDLADTIYKFWEKIYGTN